MTMQNDYPVKTICEVLDLPRSSFYHRTSESDDRDLQAALLDLAGQYPTYGYRRLTALLKRTGWSVNHKRIQRMMAQMGLQRPVKLCQFLQDGFGIRQVRRCGLCGILVVVHGRVLSSFLCSLYDAPFTPPILQSPFKECEQLTIVYSSVRSARV